MPPFDRWGTAHLVAIFLTLALPLALGWGTRRARAPWVRRACEVFFVTKLVGETIGRLVWQHQLGTMPPLPHLAPLHLCDWALWACVLACLGRWPLAYECAYFWGLAGTLQGLVTPDLAWDFPSVQFHLFFLGHGGIVACVLYLSVSGLFRPTWLSVRRAYAGLLVYGVVAGTYNALAGTNYGYLVAKPAVSSLLDHLGPWPWYLLSLLALAAVNFSLLYVPWLLVTPRPKGAGSAIADGITPHPPG